MLSYGFCTETNHFDDFPVIVQLNDDDSLYNGKIIKFQKNKMYSKRNSKLLDQRVIGKIKII